MSGDYVCNCDPFIHSDGSKTHDEDCPVFPWCPHEVGWYVCLMPCGCRLRRLRSAL